MARKSKKTATGETVEFAHFTLAGEDFTRTLHDMMLSEMPGNAWRSIACLQGLPTQDAQAVLDGTKRLIGNETDGMDVEDFVDETYRKDLFYIYAGRIKFDGLLWYRPREQFTECSEAAAQAMKRVDERVMYVPWTKKQRGRIHARYVLFEPCSEPPMWWPTHADVQVAVKDYEERRGIAEVKADEKLARATRVRWKTQRVLEDNPYENPADVIADAFGRDLGQVSSLVRDDVVNKREKERRAVDEQMRINEINYAKEVIRVTTEVVKQAGDDWMELDLGDGNKVNVPRAPFENWALRRTKLSGFAPPWTCVSRPGMKLSLDDPYHTDWMCGAGLDLADSYKDPVQKASWDAASALQEKYGDFECGVIVSGPAVQGEIGKDIIVLADLHPDNVDLLHDAKAVITQEGGKMAHLAQVALERLIPIVRVKDALQRFLPGTRVIVNATDGYVHNAYKENHGLESTD